ncbi:MAG: C39 family peptidase [Alicyclobacillaceae bacterium]|nr:C39 family peptidase [Alicyclobacillaceae bacterium]
MNKHRGRRGRRPMASRRRSGRRTAALLLGAAFTAAVAFSIAYLPHVLGISGRSASLRRSPARSAWRSPQSQHPSTHPTQSVLAKQRPAPLPQSVLLSVPAQSQLPQLPDGCEMTSLSMMLTAMHHPVSKMWLAAHMPLAKAQLIEGANGLPKYWGDPNVGFVGDVYSSADGYGIYHGPVARFLDSIVPGAAVDLTDKPFSVDLASVAAGRPVMLWTTATFQPTDDWVTWESPQGPIRATFEEHVVLLVGYNATQLFINNPLNGEKAEAVNKSDFLQAWHQLGDQAVTYRLPVGVRRRIPAS